MNPSSLDIKKVAIFASIFITGFSWFMPELDLDADTVINIIAILLFIGACGFFIFPRLGGRKHRTFMPRHKQYKESLYSDFIMERIMKAYEGEARNSSPTNVDGSIQTTVGVQKEQIDEEIDDESIDGEQEEETAEEEISDEEEFSEETEELDDEDTDEELEHRQYNDSRLTDYVMAKIMKAYNVEEEADDIDDETDSDDDEDESEEVDEEQEEVEEESGEDIDEEVEKTSGPILYEEYNNQEKVAGLKAYFTPVRLPLTLAILWFFVPAILKELVPDIHQRIPKPFSMGTFTFLPVLFLVGLNGLLGILFKPFSDNLETTPEEKRGYIVNILKILICWGMGIYILMKIL